MIILRYNFFFLFLKYKTYLVLVKSIFFLYCNLENKNSLDLKY